MTKRELIKRLKMELWVADKVIIPKGTEITSKSNQGTRLQLGFLTIGEVRMILRSLTGKDDY